MEACDGLDDDMDSMVDEGCSCESRATQDCFVGDPAFAGVGACTFGVQTCEDAEIPTCAACEGWGSPGEEECNEVDDDCDGEVDEEACDDECADAEECNGLDDDCDGEIDEGCPDGIVVGRSLAIGAGRILVWGDEHVASSTYGATPLPFWESVIDWLAGPGRSARVALVGLYPDPAIVAGIEARGHTVTEARSIPTGTALDAYDVVVVKAFHGSAVPPASRSWVESGGGLMTLVVGLGSGYSEECDTANAYLSDFPLSYDCGDPTPWGPVTVLPPHPATTGVVPADVPFVNGRRVVEEPGTGSSIVGLTDR